MQCNTFPRSCRSLHQSFLQFTAELTSMFHKKTQQSQGGCNITVIITVFRSMLIFILIR